MIQEDDEVKLRNAFEEALAFMGRATDNPEFPTGVDLEQMAVICAIYLLALQPKPFITLNSMDGGKTAGLLNKMLIMVYMKTNLGNLFGGIDGL